MTLVLRQISQRATGGEIVRKRDLTGDVIRIGRGADCEIRIPDLAVSLHHADLVRDDQGRLRIEARGEQPFGLNGRFVQSATIAAGDGAVLSFGDHRLAVSVEGGSVVLTLSRIDTAPDAAADAVADATGYAPKRALLGKRRMAWTGLGVIALACLIIPILAFTGALDGWLHPRIDVDAQWSTGPLSASHDFLEDDCQACHTKAFVSVRDETCKTCHDAAQSGSMLARVNAQVASDGGKNAPSRVADHAAPTRLMWATPDPGDIGGQAKALARRIFNRPEQRCATCHIEHVGNPLTDAPRPKPTLQETQTCTGCHTDLDQRLKDTVLRNAPSWSQHPEMHPVVTVRAEPLETRRISMAAGPRENSGLTFPHDLHLSGTGGVARMASGLGKGATSGGLDCASCHMPQANGTGFKPVEMESACGSCHSLGFATAGGTRQLPHGDVNRLVSFLSGPGAGGPVSGARPDGPRRRPGDAAQARAAARPVWRPTPSSMATAAFSPGGACHDCHTAETDAGKWRVRPVRLADAWLTRGGFDHRTEAHRVDAQGRPTCATCHSADKSGDATDVLLPRLSTCQSCHGKTQATAPAVTAPANCSTCHSYHAPARPEPLEPGRRREPMIMDDRAPGRRSRLSRREAKTPVR